VHRISEPARRLIGGWGVPKVMALENRTGVITGAAGGIGRAIAISLARRGCHLALADVNEAGLAETATLIASRRVRVSRHRLDVADRGAVAAFPDVVAAEHPGVDILVNNAGVALGGTFEEVSDADFEWLFDINFWGVVRMTRAFLPLLKSSDDARIVNLSSIFGIIAPPGQTAYSASKFAVRGFSQALRHELEGTRVGVTVVHPGGVATHIADHARVPEGTSAEDIALRREWANKHLKLPAATAGEIIAEAIEHRRPRVLVGADAKRISLIERIAPVSYWKILQRLRGGD
jgi:NAD(P)-dependent dehydrogenase (short-subunit alcohol dehydrogenase family)